MPPLERVGSEVSPSAFSAFSSGAYFVPDEDTLKSKEMLPFTKAEELNGYVGSVSFVPLKMIGGLETRKVILSFFVDESRNVYALFSVSVAFGKKKGIQVLYEDCEELLGQLKAKFGNTEPSANRSYNIYKWTDTDSSGILLITTKQKKEPDKAVCLFYGNADLSGQARELSMRQITTAPESEKEDAGI